MSSPCGRACARASTAQRRPSFEVEGADASHEAYTECVDACAVLYLARLMTVAGAGRGDHLEFRCEMEAGREAAGLTEAHTCRERSALWRGGAEGARDRESSCTLLSAVPRCMSCHVCVCLLCAVCVRARVRVRVRVCSSCSCSRPVCAVLCVLCC